MRTMIFVLVLVLGITLLYLVRPRPELPTPPSTSDSLTMIYAILTGDKKECKLLDHWPSAPITMLEAARKYKLDPYLLPTISRAEGPTPAMLKACNVYGLEAHGKLIGFIAHEYATDAAAALLAKHKGRYDAGGVINIDSLAAIWCPANRELWASNMRAIYTKALNTEADLIKQTQPKTERSSTP